MNKQDHNKSKWNLVKSITVNRPAPPPPLPLPLPPASLTTDIIKDNKITNLTHTLEKLWKSFYHVAVMFPKENPPYHMVKEYLKILHSLNKLKLEAQKTIETIRINLFHSRPTISNGQQLEDYIKRIDFANEIIIQLEKLMTKIFDTYIEFINIYWDTDEKLETAELEKILFEKYDMSLTEWQFILNKIERFNEIIKKFT